MPLSLSTRGGLTFFLHSTTPKGSFRCSSLHVSLLKWVSLRHSDRIRRTVWDLWPHSHWLLFTNFRPYKKARRPIFPVLICVISALSGFLILLCNCKTLVLGRAWWIPICYQLFLSRDIVIPIRLGQSSVTRLVSSQKTIYVKLIPTSDRSRHNQNNGLR